MFKKFYKIIICSFLVLFTPSLFAEPSDSLRKIVKVGYIENYGVINSPFITGKEGFGYEYLKELEKYSNHIYEFLQVDENQALELLQDGSIDLIGPTTKSDKNYNYLEYPKNNFGIEEITLFAPKNNNVYYNKLEDVSDLKIVVSGYSKYEPALRNYLEENNINPTILRLPDSSNTDFIKDNDYDAFLSGSLYSIDGVNIVAKLGTEAFYFVAKKGNIQIINEIDSAIDKLKKDNFYFAEELYFKYYNNYKIAYPPLTDNELQILDAKETYTVAYNSETQPIAYTDDQGNPKGISVELLKEIAKIAQINLNFIETNNAQLIADINLSVTGDSDLRNHYTTVPFTDVQLVILATNDIDPADAVSIGALNYNSVNIDDIVRKYSQGKLIRYDTISNLFSDFRAKKLDRVIVPYYTAEAILSTLDAQSYAIYPIPVNLPLTINISKRLPFEVQKLIEKTINTIDEDFVNALVVRNVSQFKLDLTFFETLYQYRYIIALSILAFFIIMLTTILVLLNKKKKALKKIIETDSLTGIMSIVKFEKEVKKRLKTAKPQEYVILALDIDNFKLINQLYGYKKGNTVLKRIPNLLENIFGKNSICYRENDIFILFTKNTYNGKTMCGKELCTSCFSKKFTDILGDTYHVNISQGVYIIHNLHEKIDYMIDCANSARLKGKDIYGATMFDFSEEMLREQNIKNAIITNMETALENNRFYVVYQPKYSLSTNKIVGAEALVRWNSKDYGTIYPDNFIPLFEENRFIIQLDYYVLRKVCELISTHTLDFPVISVNLSGITLLQDNLLEKYTEILNEYHISPEKIEIEITESAIIENFEIVHSRVAALREIGFSISIDDFGTGISSLNRLQDITADVIKLDRGFINATLAKDKGISIIKNVLRMADDLNLVTVAEGIETESQASLLEELGCEIGQGYYYSKPIERNEFEKLILN